MSSFKVEVEATRRHERSSHASCACMDNIWRCISTLTASWCYENWECSPEVNETDLLMSVESAALAFFSSMAGVRWWQVERHPQRGCFCGLPRVTATATTGWVLGVGRDWAWTSASPDRLMRLCRSPVHLSHRLHRIYMPAKQILAYSCFAKTKVRQGLSLCSIVRLPAVRSLPPPGRPLTKILPCGFALLSISSP